MSASFSLWNRCAQQRRPAAAPPTRRLLQAHWYYEDFCRTAEAGPALKSFSLREFAELMFAQHPSLERHKVRTWVLYGVPADVEPATGPTGRHLQAVHSLQGMGTVFIHRPFSEPEPQHNVPVFGAIMVNPALDKCLMVKGWKSGASWGFPKGKARGGLV